MSSHAGPRRRTDRHSVLVKALPRQPGHQLDHWVKTSRRAKRLRVVDALYDLMPRRSDPGGRDAPFIRPKENDLIKSASTTLRQQLLCDGYTVNGCLTVWHLYAIELKPFRRLIAAGVESVMTAHLLIPTLDAERPATLSPKVLTDLLRVSLDFQGLIVTDALVMEAISKRWGAGEAARLAFAAGADLILMPADADAAIRAGVRGIEHVTSFGTALAEPVYVKRFKEAIRADSNARRRLR